MLLCACSILVRLVFNMSNSFLCSSTFFHTCCFVVQCMSICFKVLLIVSDVLLCLFYTCSIFVQSVCKSVVCASMQIDTCQCCSMFFQFSCKALRCFPIIINVSSRLFNCFPFFVYALSMLFNAVSMFV